MVSIHTLIRHNGATVPTTVEAAISDGIGIHLAGLCSEKTKESLLRVFTALSSAGYRIPGKKITVNIMPKIPDNATSGSLDAAIAVAVLIAGGQFTPSADLSRTLVVGELMLDGHLREVRAKRLFSGYARLNGLRLLMPTGASNLPGVADTETLTQLLGELGRA